MAKLSRAPKQATNRKAQSDLLDRPAARAADAESTARQTGDPKTRQKLLDAAMKVFAEKSFLTATVDDIVRRAKCARGTFYLYFKDKEDIFAHLVEQVVHDMLEDTTPRQDATQDVYERIKASNRSFLKTWKKRAGVLRELHVVASFNPAVEGLYVRLEQRFVDRFRRRLERSMRDAEQDDINLDVASWMFALMAEMFAYAWLSAKRLPGGDQLDLEDVVSTMSALMYRAIFLEPSHQRAHL